MEPDSDCVVESEPDELEPDSDCVVDLELDSDSGCVVDEQSNGCMTICPVPPSMGAVVKLPAVAAVVAIRVAVPAGAAEFNSAVVAIGEDLLA